MTPLFAAALALQDCFEARRWEFCIIGGLALLRWGEPRFTRDVDVTLLVGFGEEEAFLRPLLTSYRPRISDALEFATRNRVLLVEAANGVPLDIALGGLPYEALAVKRSSKFEFEPGCLLRTCSAEDLVVQKLFALRQRDLLDVDGIVTRMHGKLDWDYIERQLIPLAEVKEEPRILARLAELRGG